MCSSHPRPHPTVPAEGLHAAYAAQPALALPAALLMPLRAPFPQSQVMHCCNVHGASRCHNPRAVQVSHAALLSVPLAGCCVQYATVGAVHCRTLARCCTQPAVRAKRACTQQCRGMRSGGCSSAAMHTRRAAQPLVQVLVDCCVVQAHHSGVCLHGERTAPYCVFVTGRVGSRKTAHVRHGGSRAA